MFTFLKDFFVYPFDRDKKNNKFFLFMKMLFRDYPAFLRIRPTIQRIMIMPFLFIYQILDRKKKTEIN